MEELRKGFGGGFLSKQAVGPTNVTGDLSRPFVDHVTDRIHGGKDNFEIKKKKPCGNWEMYQIGKPKMLGL